MKLFIEDLDIKGKKVVMRVDFNVPLDQEGNMTDATRIEEALKSIRYILNAGGALILMSHLGRPQGKQSQFSLMPVAKKLGQLLNQEVILAPDCIGKEVETLVQKLKPKEILLLENLRFYPAEEHPEKDPHFAKALASYGELYVNDAFATAHRKHSSTYTITTYFPGCAAAGYLMEKEIHFLGELLTDPERPFYGLMGGAKISTKIAVIESLLQRVDKLIVGGAMAYTFLKVQGIPIGDSLVEEEHLSTASSLLKHHGDKILLPIDWVSAPSLDKGSLSKTFSMKNGIEQGYQGFDIGPESVEIFKKQLKDGKTLLWNGPFGVCESPFFTKGTYELARFIANLKATTIAGGGDLIAAIKKAGVSEHFTHLSTGGGATLEYIEKGTLPAIEALSTKA